MFNFRKFFSFSFRMNPFVPRKRKVNSRQLRNRLQQIVDNAVRNFVSVTGERLNSESQPSAEEETGFVADDEADNSSDEEEEVFVAHDTRRSSSPEDNRMENVLFTESVASECEVYYTDEFQSRPLATKMSLQIWLILLTSRMLISTLYFLKKRKSTVQPNYVNFWWNYFQEPRHLVPQLHRFWKEQRGLKSKRSFLTLYHKTPVHLRKRRELSSSKELLMVNTTISVWRRGF
jgi:hypothetical protein